jgi:hypothetical protein
MEIRDVAKKMIEAVEYDGRKKERVFEDVFKWNLIYELEEEGSDFSDEEIEEFAAELREEFLEMVEERGWETDYCDRTIIITKGGNR